MNTSAVSPSSDARAALYRQYRDAEARCYMLQALQRSPTGRADRYLSGEIRAAQALRTKLAFELAAGL